MAGIKGKKMQLMMPSADFDHLVELADLMTMSPSQLASFALKDWLLKNYCTVKHHYTQ